jgi:hypothetical protein
MQRDIVYVIEWKQDTAHFIASIAQQPCAHIFHVVCVVACALVEEARAITADPARIFKTFRLATAPDEEGAVTREVQRIADQLRVAIPSAVIAASASAIPYVRPLTLSECSQEHTVFALPPAPAAPKSPQSPMSPRSVLPTARDIFRKQWPFSVERFCAMYDVNREEFLAWYRDGEKITQDIRDAFEYWRSDKRYGNIRAIAVSAEQMERILKSRGGKLRELFLDFCAETGIELEAFDRWYFGDYVPEVRVAVREWLAHNAE